MFVLPKNKKWKKQNTDLHDKNGRDPKPERIMPGFMAEFFHAKKNSWPTPKDGNPKQRFFFYSPFALDGFSFIDKLEKDADSVYETEISNSQSEKVHGTNLTGNKSIF